MKPVLFCLLLLFGATLNFGGCEEITDSNELPYTQHLVVYAVLYTDDSLSRIEIRRSMPLSKSYSDDEAWVTNAQGSITVDGVSYPLQHTDNAFYAIPGLHVESGKRYRLDVAWNGMHTSGSTTVPLPSPIDTGRASIVVDDYGYPEAIVWLYTHVASPVALLATYDYKRQLTAWDSIEMQQDPYYRPDTAWHSYGVTFSNIALATVGVSDSASFRAYSDISSNEEYRAVLYTYDPAFYEFARTFNRYDDDSPFGSGGTNPRWNLDGDGIGLFTGVAVTRKPVSFH